jgi:NitT/TauT family transport system permease protein/sulfonate transport system permease protein
MLPFVLPVVLVAAWALASAAGKLNPYLMPPPWEVWDAGVDLARRGLLTKHIQASLIRVFVGFSVTAVCACVLALIVHLSPLLHDTLRHVLTVLRVVPPLAAIPLLILWFGIDEASKLAVIMLASFFPVYMNVLTALRQTDRRFVEMGQTLGLTTGEKIAHIFVPGALPGVITGLRLGFGYSWRALIGAELIAASAGLGYMITEAGEMARTDRVLVGILIIAVLGAAFDALFTALARRWTAWQALTVDDHGRV